MKYTASLYGFHSPYNSYQVIWHGTYESCSLVFLSGYITIGVYLLLSPFLIFYYKNLDPGLKDLSQNERNIRKEHINVKIKKFDE